MSAPDYGEPWGLSERGEIVHRSGRFEHSTGQKSRVIGCVNACAGAEDPKPGELAGLRADRVINLEIKLGLRERAEKAEARVVELEAERDAVKKDYWELYTVGSERLQAQVERAKRAEAELEALKAARDEALGRADAYEIVKSNLRERLSALQASHAKYEGRVTCASCGCLMREGSCGYPADVSPDSLPLCFGCGPLQASHDRLVVILTDIMVTTERDDRVIEAALAAAEPLVAKEGSRG